MASDVGVPVTKNMQRTEDDTNDVVVKLLNDDGTAATVVGWTATLSIGSTNDLALIPPQTYTGVGVAGGLIPIDMDGFNLAIGDYKYDIRVIDTVIVDQPSRVYFKGKFKVTPRVN